MVATAISLLLFVDAAALEVEVQMTANSYDIWKPMSRLNSWMQRSPSCCYSGLMMMLLLLLMAAF